MARLSLWNSGRHSNDYKFIDKAISGYFNASGTALYVHKWIGVYDQSANGIAQAALLEGGITAIEDTLLLENRDRAYDPIIYELRCLYPVADTDFDLRQFGLFLQNDTVFLEIHLNDMIEMIGRRIVAGDVIELPHQRDDSIPGSEDKVPAPAINKFYAVEDASRASDGYSPTWWPHIWRLKCVPLTASQEYTDILNQAATDPNGLSSTDLGSSGFGGVTGTGANGTVTLGDLLSNIGVVESVNNAVVEAALANFTNRNFETQQYWIMPGTETGDELPWIFAGDGIPPNGEGKPLQAGLAFPTNAHVGDYYLRLDYSPSTLFKRVSVGWEIQEINYRQQQWTAAHRLLYDFINNDKTSTFDDGHSAPEKTPISQAVKPRADF